jgi:hypothetical protein
MKLLLAKGVLNYMLIYFLSILKVRLHDTLLRRCAFKAVFARMRVIREDDHMVQNYFHVIFHYLPNALHIENSKK